MRREILFRGKDKATNRWVYGDYTHNEGLNTHYISRNVNNTSRKAWEVAPDTIGQYTGRKDKNRVKIFDGDIVRFSYITDGVKPIEIECLAKVVFEDGSFMIKCVKGHVHNSMQRALFAMDYFNIKVEVVGNITDNPELMK